MEALESKYFKLSTTKIGYSGVLFSNGRQKSKETIASEKVVQRDQFLYPWSMYILMAT